MNLDSLNASQKEAVLATNGPLMVLAGAGSGKTRTLVAKITYLLDEMQVSPYKILAMTFSNKAAKEMLDRVARSVTDQIGALQITTFHSFCARLLRFEATYLGLGKNFTIYDDSESKMIMKNILGRRGINSKESSPYEYLYFIDELKNAGYYKGRSGDFAHLLGQDPEAVSIFEEYEAELRRANAVDFGGLIIGAVELFEKHSEVLARYQERFEYILVDEYQDTNRAQFDLITMLSAKKKNLCVVGDEDQSIYSWRGADIRNILDFEKMFPDAKVIKLEQNYRSCKNIIDAATSVISNNTLRKGKTMWTENNSGDTVEILELHSDKDEAEFVGSSISKLVKNSVRCDDIAVFYRTNAQSRQIEESLKRVQLPYKIIGGIRFYERKEIKDLLCYLRLLVNPKDSLAFSRIVNVPARGVGTTTLKKLELEAERASLSLYEVTELFVQNPVSSLVKFQAKVKTSLGEFFNLMYELKNIYDNQGKLSHILEKIIFESGYMEMLKSEKSYESEARIENIEELQSAVKQYEKDHQEATLDGFLELVTLNSSVEKDGESQSGEISLITAHGAKGLEFPYVFVTGAEENIFPSYHSAEKGELGVEEERRLFYVAMTRAMKKLTITYTQSRLLFGQVKFNGPSRFLYEIDKRFCKWEKSKTEASPHYGYASDDDRDWEDEYEDDTPVIRVEKKVTVTYKFPKGVKIRHSLYGSGIVLESNGSGTDEKVSVRFEDGSVKRFMSKYVPMQII